MAFLNENVAVNLPVNAKFQVGRSNSDNLGPLERGVALPWMGDPKASWVYFDCTIGCMLDSGIVVHNRLPQVDNPPDTLAVSAFGLDDPNFDKITPTAGGVNLRCQDQYTDIVQRMGHARYWFRIWGQALRFGYQVPIPGIKYIGGVPAIPYDRNPQWAYNRIAPGGNYGGIILWHAAWSLWYTTAVPPKSSQVPAADPSAHIRGDAKQPNFVQVPFSQPDDSAVKSAPPSNSQLGFQTSGNNNAQIVK